MFRFVLTWNINVTILYSWNINVPNKIKGVYVMSVFYSWLFDTYDFAPEDFHCMGCSEQMYYLFDFSRWLESFITDV